MGYKDKTGGFKCLGEFLVKVRKAYDGEGTPDSRIIFGKTAGHMVEADDSQGGAWFQNNGPRVFITQLWKMRLPDHEHGFPDDKRLTESTINKGFRQKLKSIRWDYIQMDRGTWR